MPSRHAFHPARAIQDLCNARQLLGKRLTSLRHDQYYFKGEKDLADVGALIWTYEEGQTLCMYLLSDGESVGADALPLQTPPTFEIEPGAVCAWRREDLLASLAATRLLGTRIIRVEGLFDRRSDPAGRLAGFRVGFETGDSLLYCNQGDEALAQLNDVPVPAERAGCPPQNDTLNPTRTP